MVRPLTSARARIGESRDRPEPGTRTHAIRYASPPASGRSCAGTARPPTARAAGPAARRGKGVAEAEAAVEAGVEADRALRRARLARARAEAPEPRPRTPRTEAARDARQGHALTDAVTSAGPDPAAVRRGASRDGRAADGRWSAPADRSTRRRRSRCDHSRRPARPSGVAGPVRGFPVRPAFTANAGNITRSPAPTASRSAPGPVFEGPARRRGPPAAAQAQGTSRPDAAPARRDTVRLPARRGPSPQAPPTGSPAWCAATPPPAPAPGRAVRLPIGSSATGLGSGYAVEPTKSREPCVTPPCRHCGSAVSAGWSAGLAARPRRARPNDPGRARTAP